MSSRKLRYFEVGSIAHNSQIYEVLNFIKENDKKSLYCS